MTNPSTAHVEAVFRRIAAADQARTERIVTAYLGPEADTTKVAADRMRTLLTTGGRMAAVLIKKLLQNSGSEVHLGYSGPPVPDAMAAVVAATRIVEYCGKNDDQACVAVIDGMVSIFGPDSLGLVLGHLKTFYAHMVAASAASVHNGGDAS